MYESKVWVDLLVSGYRDNKFVSWYNNRKILYLKSSKVCIVRKLFLILYLFKDLIFKYGIVIGRCLYDKFYRMLLCCMWKGLSLFDVIYVFMIYF